MQITLPVFLCLVCREQWTLCRNPAIWNTARSPSGVMPSACRESRCTVGEGGEVYGCAWVWRSLCEGVLSLASVSITNNCGIMGQTTRLHRPLLCYRNYKNPTALTIVLASMTDCDVCECFPLFIQQKKGKIPFGVDDRWPLRLSREKRRQTKRWRNRGQISLLRWKKTLKLHLTSVTITILERDGGRKESVQEMGIMACDNY